jgi:hypothetical protein
MAAANNIDWQSSKQRMDQRTLLENQNIGKMSVTLIRLGSLDSEQVRSMKHVERLGLSLRLDITRQVNLVITRCPVNRRYQGSLAKHYGVELIWVNTRKENANV